MTLITQHFDSLATDVMRINYMAHDVSEMLQGQTRLLRMRALGLPDELVNDAGLLSDSLEVISKQLEEGQTELAQLRALAHTAALINSSVDLNEVLSRAMDTVIGLTDAERGYILLQNEETGEMEFMIGRKIGREAIQAEDFTVSRGVIDKVIESGRPVLTEDAQDDVQFSAHESIMRHSFRSILCVPLVHREQVTGVVYADHRFQRATFGELELQMLVAFAHQASVAIQNAQLFERVKARLAEVTENQQLLNNIFASITSGVITTDTDGLVRTCSPVAEIILNVKEDDIRGHSLLDILPTLPDGYENVLERVQSGAQETIPIDTVMENRPTNLQLKLSPLKSQGDDTTMGVALVVEDLTEIKQRDEKINVIRTYISSEMIDDIENIEGLGLSGVERKITALFADVRGFTTFSEHLEPETLMEVINQYLTTSSRAIQKFTGIIDKYMGDAVVGLYNTQLNDQEDHALRAVRSGVEICETVQLLHKELPGEQCLLFGVGVHTGMAVLGNVGSPSRKEFTALGEAVTFSKKLQEIALPGEVIISAETYEVVKDYVEAEAVSRQLRGTDKTVNAYKVLKLVDEK
jgi:PAS domain S-box-containing protein